MTGPEHYREAERLLDLADGHVSQNWPLIIGELKADVLAAAQVHATLAQAAATIYAIPGAVGPEWAEGRS